MMWYPFSLPCFTSLIQTVSPTLTPLSTDLALINVLPAFCENPPSFDQKVPMVQASPLGAHATYRSVLHFNRGGASVPLSPGVGSIQLVLWEGTGPHTWWLFEVADFKLFQLDSEACEAGALWMTWNLEGGAGKEGFDCEKCLGKSREICEHLTVN